MLKGENITLRAAEPDDLDKIFGWENESADWIHSGTLIPFSKNTLQKYLSEPQDLLRDRQFRFLIEMLDGSPAGMVDLFDYDPVHMRSGLGVFIDVGYRNQGLAKEAIGVALDYCNGTLGLNQVWCSVREDNGFSIRLFESLGFDICGKRKSWYRQHDTWLDEVLFQKLLG